MVTDRCTTSCLLVFLATAIPRWALVFQGLIALDFASHYMHMYASSNKIVLFSLCAFNELFFIACYLLSFSSPVIPLYLNADIDGHGPLQPEVEVDTSLLAKMFPDPFSSAALELARSNKIDKYWPNIVAMGCFPFMALKQAINVMQLVQASQRLARVDVQRRRG
ncbi:hypothetical protein TGAMA5MH_00303 [Trichoderma gamsii]|uniref:CDP-diacylglycerol--inositol 3-phosphatidyltransferase n=1 Tax=Trichoderma gamsii TaxID=398673 RepID=A0A2K0TSX1_9HYPO|nr:hypothetical protein TGAMA5MH_00303 [Trichoderma gamsii]